MLLYQNSKPTCQKKKNIHQVKNTSHRLAEDSCKTYTRQRIRAQDTKQLLKEVGKNRRANPKGKWAKLPKRKLKTGNKHMKRCSTSEILQVKTTQSGYQIGKSGKAWQSQV